MIKILQFGEGNFLRTFVDYYFDVLNDKVDKYRVSIIKPIIYGNLDKFKNQKNKYHIILRGVENNIVIEKVREINCIENAISPFEDYKSYIKLALDEELKLIVSNTTEAGICFNKDDKIENFENITYPAKLTKFLFERFNNNLQGVYILPVELIDNNADQLKKCVDSYIKLWNLPKSFAKWNDEQNFYCNTLVDRIVSGYPKTKETEKKLINLIGDKDELMSVGEPFGLWAIEDKGNLRELIEEGYNGIDVALTKDIEYYKKRKVRVLNGSHTNIVPVGLYLGLTTVYDCMINSTIYKYLNKVLYNEIAPFVSSDIEMTKQFAVSIISRFSNPFLNHELVSISLNSISKWRARDLPSFKDFYNRYKIIPKGLTLGFSFLIKIYTMVEKEGGKYFVKLPTRKIELLDDVKYLEHFLNKKDEESIFNFMQNKEIFGEDLTSYNGFYEKVIENINRINNGEDKKLVEEYIIE